MGFDHGAGGATGTAGAGGATGTAGAGGATGTAPRLRLSIVGTGYLGATHAVCMAELGFDVVLGLDVDDGKIAKLAAGEAPFYEPGLEPLLPKSLDSGRLRFTTCLEPGVPARGVRHTDTMRPDRLVFGVASAAAAETLREVYASAISAGTPVVSCDFATAELVKAG